MTQKAVEVVPDYKIPCFVADKIMDVQILDNAGFVWNKDHVRTLREKHRIIGSAIGITPKNFNINLPFILMPVEIQLLKEKKIIKLYRVDSSITPSEDKISRLVLF